MTKDHVQVRGYDLDLEVLEALGTLSPQQREAWVKRYVRGELLTSSERRNCAEAQALLAAALVAPERLAS